MAIYDGGDEFSCSDELSFSWGDKLSDVGDLSSNPYEAFKEKSLLPFLDFPLTLLTSLAKPAPTTFTSLFLSLPAERFPLKMKAPHLQKGLPPLSVVNSAPLRMPKKVLSVGDELSFISMRNLWNSNCHSSSGVMCMLPQQKDSSSGDFSKKGLTECMSVEKRDWQ